MLNSILIRCEKNQGKVPLLDYFNHIDNCKVNLKQDLDGAKAYQKINIKDNSNKINTFLTIHSTNFTTHQTKQTQSSRTEYSDSAERFDSEVSAKYNENNTNTTKQTKIPQEEKVIIKPNNKHTKALATSISTIQNTEESNKRRIIYIHRWFSNLLIPKLNTWIAALILLFNVFIPGFGTILLCCAHKFNDSSNYQKSLTLNWIGVACCHFVVVIFGYIQAVSLGIILVKLSFLDKYDEDLDDLFANHELIVENKRFKSDAQLELEKKYEFRNELNCSI